MAAPLGNKYALGLNQGRPAHYETGEELMIAVKEFFDECDTNKTKATITGLTLYLGFCSRASLDDYIKRSQDFSYIIKRAKLAVEYSYEMSGQAFDIFCLKNMGWSDKTEMDVTSKGEQINGFNYVPPKE